MTTSIKVRGIYSTALTKLLLDGGYAVSDPSTSIRERFNLPPNRDPHHLLIQDRDDHQGIDISGEPERLCQLISFLQEQLVDAVLVECNGCDEQDEQMRARVEFPGAAKDQLDELRRSVASTVNRHHRLKIIDSDALRKAEDKLLKSPQMRGSIEENLFRESIMGPLEKNGAVKLEHIRPSGKAMRPREGALVSAGSTWIVFKRSFSQGHYDGLDLLIHSGDYGLTEIVEGQWYINHRYYTREGKLIGEYVNINTPVELYPYGARYLDLEVDVVMRAEEEPFLIDQEKLNLLAKRGAIGSLLLKKAMEVAGEVAQILRGEGQTS
jgi:hypothetical protein